MSIYISDLEFPNHDQYLSINIDGFGKVCYNLDLECKKIATATPVEDSKCHYQLIKDLRQCGSCDLPLAECRTTCSRHSSDYKVDPDCAGRLMREAADALELAETGVSVRCFQECHWLVHNPGSFYEPPSCDCEKEKDLDRLGLVPEYDEFDDVDAPDCPFHLTFNQIEDIYREYTKQDITDDLDWSDSDVCD